MHLNYSIQPKAILILEDGKVFEGKAAGKIGITKGEICFNTGMTGYQEIFTDPSYYGQIVVMTASHVGNYGVDEEEVESDSVKIAGMVCKKFNKGYSRPRSKKSLQNYFEESNIVGISDVDTRALVRHLRDKGSMNCIISSEILDVEVLKQQLRSVPNMEGLELSSKVSTKHSYFYGDSNAKYKVAILDYGVKKNILRSLIERDCYLQIFPIHASVTDILAFKPDGIMLSNGPGDPSAMPNEIKIVKELVDTQIPVFGICLGHQLLALSQGISTFKMLSGHRGINSPVKNLINGKCEITSQNHGFSVSADDIAKNPSIEVTHVNLNDQTIEGIHIKNKNAFSVQYHPEACPGPHDARYLFDEFVTLMENTLEKR